MTTDAQMTARFAAQIRSALPGAIGEAFGGTTNVSSLTEDLLPLLLMRLGDGQRLHLELETVVARQPPRILTLIMRPQDAERLFDLEPADPAALMQPDTQLRLLSECSEGAEALAGALAGALAASGIFATMSVSGASLEEEDASATVALTALGGGDLAALALTLDRPGIMIELIIAAPLDLAEAVAAGSGPKQAAAGATVDERVATLAAMPSRQAPEPPPAPRPAPVAPPPAPPPVTAHPFAFGQIESSPPPAGRYERDVDLIRDVSLHVRVELGSTRLTVEEVLGLSPGSVVELDRLAGEAVDIVVNDRLIARGEVVVVEENFGVRITEIVTVRGREPAMRS